MKVSGIIVLVYRVDYFQSLDNSDVEHAADKIV